VGVVTQPQLMLILVQPTFTEASRICSISSRHLHFTTCIWFTFTAVVYVANLYYIKLALFC